MSKLSSLIQKVNAPLKWANDRPSSYERKGGQPLQFEGPVTCTRIYKTAGEFKRGVEQMAREGWTVVSQSSASPNRIGIGASTGWTKTLVVFKREQS